MVESGLDHFKAERAAKRMIDFINEKINESVAKRDGLTEKERKLAADLLELAKDEFENHTCNDVEEGIWEGWTIEQRKQFLKEYHEWSGQLHEENDFYIGDWEIMIFLAHKLKN